MQENKDLFRTVVPESQLDERDYDVAMFVPNQDEVPDEEFIMDMPEVEMILNQGAIGSCVAHSIVVAAKILNWQLSNKIIDFSAMALYGTRLNGHWNGVGMIPDQAIDVVRKEGLFFQRDFDERVEVPVILDRTAQFKANNPDKVVEAKNFQISGYARIYPYNQYWNQVKTALKNRMPVIGMWTLYDSFYNVTPEGRINVPNTSSETCLGNHEMLIVGWTKYQEWIVINSWGLSNGLKGVYLIPFDYKPGSLISISDTISPCMRKASNIIATIGSNIITVDGSKEEVDVAPYISAEDRTMVPVRFISEYLGASVEWIESSQKVIVRSEEHIIELQIGSNVYYIDGKKHTMDTQPVLLNSRTFLPIRYISEALKCEIEYRVEDGKEIIEINSK